MNQVGNNRKTGKCYRPSKLLTSLMVELLRLKHDEEERQKKEDTKGISETGAERERSEAIKRRAVLNKRKVDLLNKVIFPSMANLTVFLEYLTLNPYLHEVFDKDLQALFFAQSKNPDQKNKEHIFKRFIMASMMQVINIQKAGNSGETYSENAQLPDYRFIISETMQLALWESFMSVKRHKYRSYSEEFLNEMMSQDMARAASWMKMFAEKAHRNGLTFNPDNRPALF